MANHALDLERHRGRGDAGAGARPSPRLAPWQVHRAMDALRAHLAQRLDLAAIARACRLSLCHFVRAFTNTVGMPPCRWLIALRIERTKELLLKTDLPLAQIALDCGFFDQSHFTLTFSRRVGMAPGRWRRQARGCL